jgi:uncharacterized membrane protein YfcA
MALGLPAVAANVTNTVALCPGFLGAMLAQSKDLQTQKHRLWIIIPAGILGSLIGGTLLLNTGEQVFRVLVPFLLLLASALIAVQETVRTWLVRHSLKSNPHTSTKLAALPVGFGAIYGGYFGAGLSVIVLAVLGLTMDDNLTRLNALKQAISFAISLAASILFVFSGHIQWSVALVMACGALLGGVLGGRLAGHLKATTLRWIVVAIGVVVATVYVVRA